MQNAVPQRPWPVTTTILLLVVVFILDLLTPAGVLMPLLYTLPLLSALLVPDRRFFLSVTGLAMVLTPLGFYISPPGGVVWIGLVNRSMALIALAVTAAFYWLHLQARARLRSLQELLPLCSGCQQVRDDKGYWKQLELYLEEHQGTQFSRGLCPTCARKEMEALPA